METNYKWLIEKGILTEHFIKASQQKIKNYSTQIAFIDQNLCATGGYTFDLTINNETLHINFPTVVYERLLETKSGLKHVKTQSEFYKQCLPLVDASIIKSAFLIIRIKDIQQLLQTTDILHEYSNASHSQLPLAIIVCSAQQLHNVQNKLNDIPIAVACSTALNFVPQQEIATSLNAHDMKKLLTENSDIQALFREHQFHTDKLVPQTSLSFFSNHMLLSSLNEKTDVEEDMVITYRYQKTVFTSTMNFFRDGHELTEFYIPSYHLCFNKEAIFYANTPENRDDRERIVTPITIIKLPVSLIEKVQSLFNNYPNDKSLIISSKIQQDVDLSTLFNTLNLSITEGQCIRQLPVNCLKDEKDFEMAYKIYGNCALIPYMINYIEGRPAHQKTIKRIIQIIDSLHDIEKKSLRENLIYNLTVSRCHLELSAYVNPTMVGLASFGMMSVATKNPIIGMGTGLVVGGATFVKNSFDSSHQKAQRQELKNRFFEALSSKNSFLFSEPSALI